MTQITDLFIIGGGINGCGIARDAAGRGLTVTLAEQGDLAQGTSSASTKLFHGGLRYLEYFEFRLVREALHERETLLAAMPHISWPMRFVLPLSPDMRFDATTPTSRLLRLIGLGNRRPDWLIRLGLFLYDAMGDRQVLPATRTLDLTTDPAGRPLKPGFGKAYEYSDCWVQDSRLVALNARDAARRGATILTQTRVTDASRTGDHWTVTTTHGTFHARALINAAGPFVAEVMTLSHSTSTEGVRLVRGSHIVTKRLYDHDRCYFFQGSDGRIIFAIPYEQDFTLIGTTDQDHTGHPGEVKISEAERDYLLTFASQYFAKPVTAQDVVWSYSGVRPLYNDGAKSATAATRDYVLSLDSGVIGQSGPPLLNVFGGKITTYRRLAEGALEKLRPHFPSLKPKWTARVPLPGGAFPLADKANLVDTLRQNHPFLTPEWATRMVNAYGTDAEAILGTATSPEALGHTFGATLTEAEVRWLMTHEYAAHAADVVWRRSKLGLRMTTEEVEGLEGWMRGASV